MNMSQNMPPRWGLRNLRGERGYKHAAPPALPTPALNRDFSGRVTPVEKVETAHRAHLAELDALFASLQHRAFKGEP
jgi:hypothetical protein